MKQCNTVLVKKNIPVASFPSFSATGSIVKAQIYVATRERSNTAEQRNVSSSYSLFRVAHILVRNFNLCMHKKKAMLL